MQGFELPASKIDLVSNTDLVSKLGSASRIGPASRIRSGLIVLGGMTKVNDYPEITTDGRILMGPGPSGVHPRVLRALGAPILGHLDPEFITIMNRTKDLLASVFETKNEFTIPISGTGSAAIKELRQQLEDFVAGRELSCEQYPYQILCNLIPQISSLKSEYEGYYGEEIKMIKETRKIFGVPDLAVSATCVRVPVFQAHSEAVNVEFQKPITPDQARAALASWPGIEVVDDPANGKYPMPLFAEGKDPTFVGRIRQDSCNPNTLDMWVVADNIRKGAALNAVQIAEMAIERGYIKARG